MASFIATLQASTPCILCRGGKVRFIAGDYSGFERLRISSYRRDFNATIASPRHVVCSISSRSRDSSTQRNNRYPNRNKNGESSASKPVSVLPGDMKLLRDLQDFISAADLPPHQVPSTQELARSGRQDLANAVRRRGEKAISQLLSNPNFLSSSGTKKQSKLNSVVIDSSKSEVADHSNGVFKPEVVPSPSIQPQDSSCSHQSTDLVPQNRTGLFVPYYEAAVERGPLNLPYHDGRATPDNATEVANSGSSIMSHDERKSKQDIQHYEPSDERKTLDVARFPEVTTLYEEGDSYDVGDTELYTSENSFNDEDEECARPKAIEIFQESQESEAWQKAALLRDKLQAFFDKPVEKSVAKPRRDLELIFNIMAKQRESEKFFQHGEQDKDMLSAGRTDPAAELARLSALLHAKVMENLRVSRELEETKAMLALVRAKHTAELAHAEQVGVEKDLRLQAAEQALHALKLTQVDWWGEGNRVELAGSFNGWEHHAYLLPDFSSKASQLPGTRGPLLWRIELWLYPGVYEIKFIVDGKWVLDSRREIIQGHMGENNLLHVEP